MKLKNKTAKFLLQPYPFYYEEKSLYILLILFFGMTFFFNYAFEPFHVEFTEHKMNYFWISIIHSITPVIVLIAIFIVGKIFKFEDDWKIFKEALLIFIFFLTVGLIQFLIRDLIYNNANNWSLHYLYEEIRNTFLVGSLFICILIPINFSRLNSKNRNRAHLINDAIKDDFHKKLQQTQTVRIDEYNLDINHFMFAKSEGNYVEIYLQNTASAKLLIRITLKNLEALLKAYPNIIKTHRSYLVNANYIDKINGNAQGYQLFIAAYTIPVSRNMIENFNRRMKQL